MPMAVYRRGADRIRVRTTGARNLPAGPRAAQRRILELIEGDQRAASLPAEHDIAPRRASL
jgi:hypothetical protein